MTIKGRAQQSEPPDAMEAEPGICSQFPTPPENIQAIMRKPGAQWSPKDRATVVRWLCGDPTSPQRRALDAITLAHLGKPATWQDADDVLQDFFVSGFVGTAKGPESGKIVVDDGRALACKLSRHNDSATQYIYGLLSEHVKNVLGSCRSNSSPPPEVLTQVASDLDRIVKCRDLCEAAIVDELELEPYVRDRLSKGPRPDEKSFFNLWVLEAVFPGIITANVLCGGVLRNYDGSGTFVGWLLICLKRFCWKAGKKIRNERQTTVPVTDLGNGEGDREVGMANLAESANDDPVGAAELKEFREFLTCCLNKIRKKHAEVFRLIHIENLPIPDTSVQLKAPQGSVRSWLRRARLKLQACLIRKGFSL